METRLNSQQNQYGSIIIFLGLSPPLNKADSLTDFQIFGNAPPSNDLLINAVKSGETTSEAYFNRHGLILSSPTALFGLNFQMMSETKLTSIGVRWNWRLLIVEYIRTLL